MARAYTPRMRRDPLADPRPLIRRVYSYVAYRVGSGPHAEDITSEVFERAVRYRSSYDPAKGDAVAWLLGIARRCLADRAAGDVPSATVADTASVDGPEDETLERLELQRAVALLDERAQELLALRYGADLSARQIASVLGMSTNAVEVALHRALARLRTVVAESEEPGQGVRMAAPVRPG